MAWVCLCECLQKRKASTTPAPTTSMFSGLGNILEDKWDSLLEEMALDFKDMVYEVDEKVEHMIKSAKDMMNFGLKNDMKRYLEYAAVKELKNIFYHHRPSAKDIFKVGVKKNLRKRHRGNEQEERQEASGPEEERQQEENFDQLLEELAHEQEDLGEQEGGQHEQEDLGEQ